MHWTLRHNGKERQGPFGDTVEVWMAPRPERGGCEQVLVASPRCREGPAWCTRV